MTEEASTPERHTLKTVEDFMALPPEKIDACLTDFAMWLKVHHEAKKYADALRVSSPVDSFGWVDDGKHEFTLTVNEGERELLRATVPFGVPDALPPEANEGQKER